MKKKVHVETISVCHRSNFHGIECLENEKEYGFEGCYNDDLNHPDPRPGHAIWIKKLHAEKLFKLFTQEVKKEQAEEEAGSGL